MQNLSPLARFAAQSCEVRYLNEVEQYAIHSTLTSTAQKIAYATELLRDAQQIYQIPEADIAGLAAEFADPAKRRTAESMLSRYPFTNPATTWAGTGYSIIMDRVFAEDDGTTHVVAVPANWSLDLWHSDRDLGEDGYTYHHWVYATLPSIAALDSSQPVRYVLVSDCIYGSLYWGGKHIQLYRGEITVAADPSSTATLECLEMANATAD
jgi:hypothetical protein